MNRRTASLALVAGALASASAFALAPAGAPAGSTGLCKDGSYSSNDTKKGACAGHKGVKDWFVNTAASSPAAKPMAAAPAIASAPMTAEAAKTIATTTTTSKSTAPVTTSPMTTPAAGGGPGQVWVNTASKTYHCSGTKYYGKTKQGAYMTEGAAKTAGNHADHGKACA